jgi:gliding motility-associated lipoprotein GldH
MFRACLLTTSLALVLFACGESFHYEKIYTPPGEIWSYEEPLIFDFSIPDTASRYTFYLDLIHSVDYPYQNLYTRIVTQYPEQEPKTDILSLELSNDLGLWEGKCRSNYCRVRIPLQTRAVFENPGDYQLSFEQHTRQDSLSGLRSIALRIQREARE